MFEIVEGKMREGRGNLELVSEDGHTIVSVTFMRRYNSEKETMGEFNCPAKVFCRLFLKII